MLHNSCPRLGFKSASLNNYIFAHVAAVLPRKTDFTLKMLCMYHIIPNQHIHVSPFIFVYIQLMSRYYYQFSPVSLESSPSVIMAGMHSFGSVLQ